MGDFSDPVGLASRGRCAVTRRFGHRGKICDRAGDPEGFQSFVMVFASRPHARGQSQCGRFRMARAPPTRSGPELEDMCPATRAIGAASSAR